MKKRTFLRNLGLATLVTKFNLGFTQSLFPNRALKFIVPSTTGITSDTLARLLAPKITQKWNIPIVVENKSGAGGIIGADAVAKSDNDGHTLLFANTSFATLAATNTKLPYDPIKSFSSISLLSSSVMTLVVTNNIRPSNVAEFIEYAKLNSGKINYSSPGLGTTQHLAMELINQKTGTKLIHVPYRGSSGAISDLIAGHVQASVVALQTAAPFIESGKIKLLAVLGSKRVPKFPNTPTMSEIGYSEIIVETWSAVMAPFGTPPAIVNKLNVEIDRVLALTEIRDSLISEGINPVGGRPEILDQFIRNEISKWTEVVRRGNIELN